MEYVANAGSPGTPLDDIAAGLRPQAATVNASVQSPIAGDAGLRFDLPRSPACLDSRTLLGQNKMVNIVHNGTLYRLQSTRQGKLILTK